MVEAVSLLGFARLLLEQARLYLLMVAVELIQKCAETFCGLIYREMYPN